MQIYTSNQRRLLDILRCHQPITRADVTDLTDLTQQSVHRILEGLIADGLVVTERGKPNGRGKPSPSLQLNDNARYSLGISLDGDGCRLNIVNFNGTLIADQKVTFAWANDSEWIRSLLATCEDALARYAVSSCQLCGVGIAVGKILNTEVAGNTLSGLSSAISDALKVPAFIERKAVAAAIGESLAGVGRNYRNFAFVSLDHDISGAVIHDSMPFRGHFGNAGDYTCLFADPADPADPQGISLHALLEELQRRGVDVADLADLQDRFDIEWPGVREWLDRASASFAKLAHSIGGILDPQAIVFGGQLPAALGLTLIEEIKRRQNRSEPLPARHAATVLLSAMAGDGAATGSALLPLKHLYFR